MFFIIPTSVFLILVDSGIPSKGDENRNDKPLFCRDEFISAGLFFLNFVDSGIHVVYLESHE